MGIHNVIAQKPLKRTGFGEVSGIAVPTAAKTLACGRGFRVLVVALLCFIPTGNSAHPEIVTVPFRTAESMILVEARVNDNRVMLVLDTGANNTIVSPRAYGSLQFKLRSIHNNDTGPGLRGDAVRLRANVTLSNRVWVSQPVYVMNVDELTRRFGAPVDGLLGQDLLREFHAVRINYKAHVIELEP
jgi:Aspartyl protease